MTKISDKRSLALCLTTAAGMTNGNFLHTCVNNSMLQTKQLIYWFLTLTQYPTMHVSSLDHFNTLTLTFQCHAGLNVRVVLDSPYITSYW